MKAYLIGGTSNDQIVEIGALTPTVLVRPYASSGLWRPEAGPGELKHETYKATGTTRATALGVLQEYVLVGSTFVDGVMSAGQANELARKQAPEPAEVIAGDEVPPP